MTDPTNDERVVGTMKQSEHPVLVERMARAICHKHCEHGFWNRSVYKCLEDAVDWNWQRWKSEAKAALSCSLKLPISEAPRDGVKILLWCPRAYPQVGRWDDHLSEWHDNYLDVIDDATHFQHLEAPDAE